MSRVLPALVGVSMLSLAGLANAAEPVTLTDAQMDEVTAGDSAQLEVYNVPSDVVRAKVTGFNQYNNKVTWDSNANPDREGTFGADVAFLRSFTTRSWWWDGVVWVESTFADGRSYTNAYNIPPYNKEQLVKVPFYNILGTK